MPPDHPPAAAGRRLRTRRPARVLTVAAALVALLVAGGVIVNGWVRSGDPPAPATRWLPAPSPAPEASPTPSPEPGPQVITLSAVGDIVLGDAGALPAGDGAGFFDGVSGALAADLVMGNLEQPLTDDTGYRKCGEDSTACHAFRAPPDYAAHLRDAGFDLLNLANNHGNDYGPQGRANTRAALDRHQIAYTGAEGRVTVVEAAGVSVATVGFSPYGWTNSLTDLTQATDVVARASGQADLVVVQAHMGAEGTDATHVRPGTETYFGENRGDPMAFARGVIDAGADLVVGHGPHVLRGLEFYQGRLIAYSLGNFAGGGGTLNAAGTLGQGAVLTVSLSADGSFTGGELVATHMDDVGLPTVDQQQRGLELVRELTAEDFPGTGAQLAGDGTIIPPAA